MHQTTEPEAILHFVRFDDSSYETDPVIGSLEALGYYGDTVLVEGVSTGTAKVTVGLMDRFWKVRMWTWPYDSIRSCILIYICYW